MHYCRAKDITNRCSMGALFQEGKERLLLNSNPMNGAYMPGQWSSHSSPALLPNYAQTFTSQTSANVQTTSLLSATAPPLLPTFPAPVKHSLSKADISLDPKGANNLSKTSLGDFENRNIVLGKDDEEIAVEKDISISGEESQDPILSSASIRLKGSQERERLDRLLKARWMKIFELASGMVAGSGCGIGQNKSHAVGNKAANAAKSAEVSGSVEGSRNFHETHTDGSSNVNGTVKSKVKKVSHSGSSTTLSSAPTAADAQALLDEACSMQPYVNAPGESFTETIRLVLGELMTVSS